jgi:uncharacterized protein YdaU (DUF1376 family)
MTKLTDHWMPLHIGDYLADTQHLTFGEHGIYLLLIMAYWRNGGALPDDDRAFRMITKASPEQWKKLRPRVAFFFDLSDGEKWRHKRIDAELEKAENITKQRRVAGANGLAKRWQTDSKPIANGIANGWQNDSLYLNKGTEGTPRTNLDIKKPLTRRSAHAHAREDDPILEPLEPATGEGEGEGEGFKKFIDRAPIARSARSAATAALRRDQLVQKLIRFSTATMQEPELSLAVGGLCGADPKLGEQWWLDHVDKLMRAERWDDTAHLDAAE